MSSRESFCCELAVIRLVKVYVGSGKMIGLKEKRCYERVKQKCFG